MESGTLNVSVALREYMTRSIAAIGDSVDCLGGLFQELMR